MEGGSLRSKVGGEMGQTGMGWCQVGEDDRYMYEWKGIQVGGEGDKGMTGTCLVMTGSKRAGRVLKMTRS